MCLPETMVEVPLEKLKELRAQIDTDEKLIEDLTAEVVRLKGALRIKEDQVRDLEKQMSGLSSGWWLGTGIGYPLSWTGMGSYRFKRWGPYFSFSVGKVNTIGGGISVKVGK